MARMNGRRRLVVVLFVATVIGISAFEFSTMSVLNAGQAMVVHSSFTFSNQNALAFFRNLRTPAGLFQVYPGSNTIFLSDDQQLDYAALVKLGDFSLADQINSTLEPVLGGLIGDFNPASCSFGNWNGVDVMIGVYMPIPCQGKEWNMYSGQDLSLGGNYSTLHAGNGFTIKETKWGGPMGGGYAQYADLELCYSINQLHFGDYVGAVRAFEHANSMWDGHGFADRAFQASDEYASFKLALDLIAFKELMNNAHTEGSVVSYSTIVNQVQDMMSKLQSADGGVVTNYLIVNGAIQFPPDTFENGETTSLFALAD